MPDVKINLDASPGIPSVNELTGAIKELDSIIQQTTTDFSNLAAAAQSGGGWNPAQRQQGAQALAKYTAATDAKSALLATAPGLGYQGVSAVGRGAATSALSGFMHGAPVQYAAESLAAAMPYLPGATASQYMNMYGGSGNLGSASGLSAGTIKSIGEEIVNAIKAGFGQVAGAPAVGGSPATATNAAAITATGASNIGNGGGVLGVSERLAGPSSNPFSVFGGGDNFASYKLRQRTTMPTAEDYLSSQQSGFQSRILVASDEAFRKQQRDESFFVRQQFRSDREADTALGRQQRDEAYAANPNNAFRGVRSMDDLHADALAENQAFDTARLRASINSRIEQEKAAAYGRPVDYNAVWQSVTADQNAARAAGGQGPPPIVPGAGTSGAGWADDPRNYNFGSYGYFRAVGVQAQQQLSAFPQSYAGRLSKGAMLAAGESASMWLGAQQSMIQSERGDIQAEARAKWGLYGGLAGAAVGSIFPGYGTLVGAGIGFQAFSSIGGLLATTEEKTAELTRSSMVSGGLSAYLDKQYANTPAMVHVEGTATPGVRTNPYTGQVYWGDKINEHYETVHTSVAKYRSEQMVRAARQFAQGINEAKFGGSDPNNLLGVTPDMLAKGYVSSYAALIEGGMNPNMDMGSMMGMEQVPTGQYMRGAPTKWNEHGRWVQDSAAHTALSHNTSSSSNRQDDTVTYAPDIPRPAGGSAGAGGSMFGSNLPAGSGPRPHSIPGPEIHAGHTTSIGVSSQSSATYDASTGHWERTPIEWEQIPIMKWQSVKTGESLGEYFMNQAARRFLSGSEEVFNTYIKPVIGNLAQFGGRMDNPFMANITDIFAKMGPGTAAAWDLITTPDGVAPKMDELSYAKAKEGFSLGQRAMQMAQLNFRNVGSLELTAVQREIDALKGLPGYKDSVMAMQLRNEEVSARFQQFQDIGRTQFDIPMAHVQGALERSQVLPYNPSNAFGLSLQQINLAQREVSRIQNFMNIRKREGHLSEDQELQFTQRIENLKTLEAQGVARLNDNLEDRLPGVMAGRPASFARFDSFQLAAMSLMRQGSPIRSYGALNGAQRQLQQDFITSYGVGGGGIQNPYDRLMGMDNAASAGMSSLTHALKDLTDAIRGNGGARSQNNSNTQSNQQNNSNQQQGSARQPGYPSDYANQTKSNANTQAQYTQPPRPGAAGTTN